VSTSSEEVQTGNETELRRPRLVRALVIVTAALIALVLQLVAIDTHSLTGDGSHHLLAGHQALRYGQNTINLEHPPLVKLVMAIPAWMSSEPLSRPLTPPEALKAIEEMHRQPELVRRMTIAGRVLLLLVFAIPFIVVCERLGRRFGPPRAGPVLAPMVALSLGVLPNLTILQTDTAAGLVFVLIVHCCLRSVERPSIAAVLGLGLVWGIGLSAKFSAVLLAPTVGLAILIPAVMANEPSIALRLRRAFVQLLVVGVVAGTILHAVYIGANRRYDSDVGRSVISAYCESKGTLVVEDRLQYAQGFLLGLERFDPYLAQWMTGILGMRAQNSIGVYPSYAFGRVCSEGRWWYHPVVLLIKTPLVILLAAVFLLLMAIRNFRKHDRAPSAEEEVHSDGLSVSKQFPGCWAPWILVVTTVCIYAGMAISSNYNLGYRHLIPIVPFLYLPIARGVARIPAAATALIAVLALESIALTPTWLAATNTWWLGEKNPTRFVLSVGNLEYRQSFVQLARETRRRNIQGLNVVYLALSSDIVNAYIPNGHTVVPGELVKPGWYAVNVMAEQYIPALLRDDDCHLYDRPILHAYAKSWKPTLDKISQGTDHGYIAGTFHLFEINAE